MLPDGVWNPGPLTYESGALPIALCGPATEKEGIKIEEQLFFEVYMFTLLTLKEPNKNCRRQHCNFLLLSFEENKA